MRVFHLAAVFLALLVALTALAPARADEISQQQEAIRAPLRAAYVKAKQAEQDALDRRQKAIDRMSALLQAGNRELDQIQSDLKTAQSKLDDKRQEQKLAARALDVALGSHGRDVNDPAVKDAQAKFDAVDAAMKDLERQVATLEQAQRDKVSIPNGDPIYKELIDASAELDQRRQTLVKVLALYMAVLRPPLPPYLQSIQVYVGADAKYRAEWRIDDQAADTATHELTGRLDRVLRDVTDTIQQMQDIRDYAKAVREDLLGPMYDYTGQINAAVPLMAFNDQMRIAGPAVIEAVGVVVEVLISGGASTAERYAVEKALDAGNTLADALTKKQAGKVLTEAEQILVSHSDEAVLQALDPLLAVVQAGLAKGDTEAFMNWRASNFIDSIGLKGGGSDALKIIVGDATEQVIARAAKSATSVLTYAVVDSLARTATEKATIWQAVRSGTSNFFNAKIPLNRLTDSFKGTARSNILGVCITAAKAVVAAHYGAKFSEAQQSYLDGMAKFGAVYHGYYMLLQVDRILQEKQRELQNFYFETYAYRLKSAGPRKLVVMQNDGVNPGIDDVTVALHFSEPLDHPPQVRLLGIQFEMKPQDKDADGRSAFWEGKVPARKLPDTYKEGVLEVRLGLGSRPYTELDSDPGTPARFVVPDDLTKDLPDREEWSDYERGADRNHHIVFTAPQAQQPVPWRDRSTCEQINCDCGAVPVRPGIGGDFARQSCQRSEKQLRDICAKQGQTLGACLVGASGPNAYPLPHNLSATAPPTGTPSPLNPMSPTPQPSPGPVGPGPSPRPVVPKPPPLSPVPVPGASPASVPR